MLCSCLTLRIGMANPTGEYTSEPKNKQKKTPNPITSPLRLTIVGFSRWGQAQKDLEEGSQCTGGEKWSSRYTITQLERQEEESPYAANEWMAVHGCRKSWPWLHHQLAHRPRNKTPAACGAWREVWAAAGRGKGD